jgi:hypothetical protein
VRQLQPAGGNGQVDQSSFNIVPMPRLLVNSELLLLPKPSLARPNSTGLTQTTNFLGRAFFHLLSLVVC